MQATDFEFRNRFWFILTLFVAAYLTALVDPVGAAEALGRPRLILSGAAVLATVGAVFRTWGSAYLGVDVVQDATVHSEALMADGPYRYVRNPLYLGLLLITVGYAFTASRVGWFVLVAGMIVFVERLIGREERALEAAQGDSFRQFKSAVPQLLPSPAPRLPPRGTKPRWRPAIVGEIWAWGMVVALVVFAARDRGAFQWAVLGALGVYAVTRFARRPS